VGRVLSAQANVNAVNRLKAAVTDAVMTELEKREKQTVNIPLGNVIGGSFFTGRGPFLPITVYTSGTVISNLSSHFDDAGINQTNHRLQLDMTVMMTAALPMERVAVELTTSFLISETVIVGEIPGMVAGMDFGDELQNIFGAND
jgi:sporulation protein YunB